jgi:hypothetical protein
VSGNITIIIGHFPRIRAPLARAGRRGARAGVSADDGKAQQHFEQSLGKRTEKKEEILLVVSCNF